MSYDASLPTDTDKARALLGDTSNSSATELFDDDHYAAVLAMESTFYAAVAFLADELVALYAQRPDRVTLPSGLSVAWSERVTAWKNLATRMRSDAYGASSTLSFVTADYGTDTVDEFGRPPNFWP